MKKASLIRLYQISLRDMLAAYPKNPIIRFILSLLFTVPALRFAYLLVRFNEDISRKGLQGAAQRLLREFYRGVSQYRESPGAERAPHESPSSAGSAYENPGPAREGPQVFSQVSSQVSSKGLLILANHPGVGDSLALLSVLERQDIFLVAAEREFFYALPALIPYLILVPEDPAKRNGVVRAMLGALKAGATVVLYPAGEIEPDPMVHPESAMLKPWSTVIGLLVRLARHGVFDFSIDCAITANVLPPHVLGKGRAKNRADQEKREKRALGKIIGLGAAKQDQIILVWPYHLKAVDLPEASAEVLTSHIMDEVVSRFHRCFPVGKNGSPFQRRAAHPG
mgnify:FL=1